MSALAVVWMILSALAAALAVVAVAERNWLAGLALAALAVTTGALATEPR